MDLAALQGYIYLIGTIVAVVMMYSYIVYLYKSEKEGVKDYEKYGNIALDDNIDSKPIEQVTTPANDK